MAALLSDYPDVQLKACPARSTGNPVPSKGLDHLGDHHRFAAHIDTNANCPAAHIDSRRSRCVWFGGQDWVGPHCWVGRLVLGHTEPKVSWWESTGHCEDRTGMVRQPDIGSGSHPDLHSVLGRCLNASLAM
jgi:hypothetical protein